MKFLINDLAFFIKDIKTKNKDELNDYFVKLGFEQESLQTVVKTAGYKYGVIENCEKHPNSDRLNYCKVTSDNVTYDVVCGGTNLENNKTIVHAIPGSKVGEIILAEKELRGVVSSGMILSMAEILGLPNEIFSQDEQGHIFKVPQTWDLNKTIEENLELDLPLLELTILSDRNYAKNVIALTKELSVMSGMNFGFEKIKLKPQLKFEAEINLNENETFKGYSEIILSDKINNSLPDRRKITLMFNDYKPTNTIKDIIKYVEFVTGNEVMIKDIDGKLFVGLITHDNGTANFNDYLGKYSIALFLKIASENNFIVKHSNIWFKRKVSDRAIEVSKESIYDYIGYEVDLRTSFYKLTQLGFVVKENKESLEIIVPNYRIDINNSADIIEELVRFFDVDNIENKSLSSTINSSINDIDTSISYLYDFLPKIGLTEIKSYKLIDVETNEKYNLWNSKEQVQLADGYSIKRNTFQTSLLSGMLEAYKVNFKNENEDIHIFEISNVYINDEPRLMLGVLIDDKFQDTTIETSLYLKEIITKYLNNFKIDFVLKQTTNELFDPNNSVEIYSHNELIGYLGELHPKILRENKLIKVDKVKAKLYYLELLIK